MADSWTLLTPSGQHQLNPTFHAPTLAPGGVDTSALLRREGRGAFQRAGDGLRTPGPLRLVGRVWRDDRDARLTLEELEAIQAAVRACTGVVRRNEAGAFAYEQVAGGPTPAITPDGRGGWVVELELWPGRAQPTFVPAAAPELLASASATATSASEVSVTVPEEVMVGDTLYLLAAGRATAAPPPEWLDPPGWTRVAGEQTVGTVTGGVVWERTAQPGDALINVTASANVSLTSAAVIVAAFRGQPPLNGHWLFGQQATVGVPVSLRAGDLFAAFAFSNNNQGSPQALDGDFPRVEYRAVGFNPTFHAALFAGDAPSRVTEVRIGHEAGATFTDIAVFVISGRND